jgi:hypothetical protein
MPEKPDTNYIDHFSTAVKDLKDAEADFRRAFGWEADGRYSDDDEKINVAYYMIGQTAPEIMEDRDGTGAVARFIDRKPRFARELNRYFAFLHPKKCHGVLAEVIDGSYKSGTGE